MKNADDLLRVIFSHMGNVGLRIEDHGLVPLPPNPGNYAPEFVKEFRTDLKPLDIVQPEGPSFQINGHEVTWQKWSLRVGFSHREGLVLHNIGY